MMDQSWMKFERLVAAIHFAESQGAEVKWNERINGRQFDVTLRFSYGLHSYLTVIECKYSSSKVEVEKVDAFVTKTRDAKANKAIMVSSSGYQAGCYEVAERHGVRLLTLNEKTEVNLGSLVSEVTPALNIYKVSFLKSDGGKFQLDDAGGRLHYLMNHIRLRSKSREMSPNQLLYEWQLTKPQLDTASENDVTLHLDENTVAIIPYEDEIPIESLCFKCKLVEAVVARQPMLDNHILEGIGTRYELIDEKGDLLHTTSSSNLKLGFDTKTMPGKFYVIPHLHNYYYCASIDRDVITWILVESYQHGHLMRATLTQQSKYSHYYVEVTDPKRISRLTRLLEDYRGKRS